MGRDDSGPGGQPRDPGHGVQLHGADLFGAALPALFLGEVLPEWTNLLALALVCGGLWRVTRDTHTRRA